MRYRPIRNSAQLTPSAVLFQSRPPEPDLAGYVSDFWQYDVLPPHVLVRIQVFPSGCVVLRFNLAATEAEPIIYGPSLRSDMKSVFVRGIAAFGAALTLQGARALVGCDVRELYDQRLDLRSVWPEPLSVLCEQLALAPAFEQRAQLLASFLRRRLRSRFAPHPDFLDAVVRLAAHDRVAALPRELRVSERTLRRHFDRHIGLSPKELQRVVRVQTAMRALVERPAATRAGLAQLGGFSDQPHFNREFKRLLAMRPGQFTRYIGRFHERELPIWSELNAQMVKASWLEHWLRIARP
jgi:AraC-like DNA-binding protein